MNFDFTPEQFALQDTVRSYLAEAWPPQRVRAAIDGDALPADLWDGLVELGLSMLLVPEEYGGLGLSLTDAALVFETLGEALAPGLVGDTILASALIARFGTAAQKDTLLPAIAEGRLKLTVAAQESATSYALDAPRTTATPIEGGWRLDGIKRMVGYAGEADRALVAARVPGSAEPGLFLCDLKAAGVSAVPHILIDPTVRASEVTFAGVALPADALIGGGEVRGALGYWQSLAAATAATQLTGIAGRALAMTVDYAKERRQFGRAIGSFQAVKHRLADMLVVHETSRSAAYYAHWALAEDAPDAAAAVALAKAYAGDMSRSMLNDSIHNHGGIGFTWDYDLHLYVKRGKLLEYAHGDATWHRERYARATIDGANR